MVYFGKPQIFKAVGDPEKEVILVLEIWELCGTEQWGVFLNGQISALSMRFFRDLKMSCVDCFSFFCCTFNYVYKFKCLSKEILQAGRCKWEFLLNNSVFSQRL